MLHMLHMLHGWYMCILEKSNNCGSLGELGAIMAYVTYASVYKRVYMPYETYAILSIAPSSQFRAPAPRSKLKKAISIAGAIAERKFWATVRGAPALRSNLGELRSSALQLRSSQALAPTPR